MSEKRLKMIFNGCCFLYTLALIYAFVINFQGKYFGMCFVSCLTPWIIPCIIKILKMKAPTEVYIINILFVFCASLWGSCLDGYDLLYFDKFVHFASGIIMSEIAYIIYKYYLKDDQRLSLMCMFINGLNALVAVLWEFYEYALYIFFRYDAIRQNTTGVHDTMTDLLVAVIGGIVLTCYLLHYDCDHKDHFFVSLQRKFYLLNQK